ncbi:MAG: pyrroline-5-carboxylate reductase dimerization domain-containing protein, partial [Burkholderiales bacterium]
CVRAVPNTAALVRAGLTGLAFADAVPAERRRWVEQLFAQVGEVHELPEAQLDAFLALTSSGPAFVAVVAEALADGAVAAGLPRLLAQRLAHRTLAGSAALLQERDLHPGQLKDMVSSPGGTTIAGLRQLEQAGLRSALIEAVIAAANEATACQRQLAAAEDEEMLKKLNPSDNEVVTLTPEEHQAFVEAVKPVTEKVRRELGEKWFGLLNF